MTKEEYLNSDFVKMAHLNNQVAYLTQINRKLEQQIEKMKRCENCSKRTNCTRANRVRCRVYKNCKDWELAE